MPSEYTISDTEYGLLRELIHRETGIWLGDHKHTLLISRMSRRLRELGMSGFAEYHRRLAHQDPGGAELRLMINLVTTNKTEFFREREHFARLAEQVRALGRMVEAPVWCAACSTGEEAWTLAITLAEELGLDRRWRVLASDIDTDVLARARGAVYPEDALAPLAAGLKQRYFLRGTGERAGLAKVRPELRQRVEFRRINLVARQWEDVDRFQAIFCRNVMIYFTRETQEAVVGHLLEHLSPDGLLYLGHSENLNWSPRVTQVGPMVYRPRRAASQAGRPEGVAR